MGSPGAYRLADVLQVAEHWFAPLRQPDLAAPALSRLGKLQIIQTVLPNDLKMAETVSIEAGGH